MALEDGLGPDRLDQDGGQAAPSKSRSAALATVVGVLFAGGVVLTLVASTDAFFAVALLVVALAQVELYSALRTAGETPAALVGVVCGAVLLVGTYARGPLALVLLAALPVPLLLVWVLTLPAARARSTVTSTYLGIAYPAVLAAFMALVLRAEHGRVLVPAFVAAVSLQDAGAYLLGRKIGRHQMSPRTSPKKTWEGLAAGTVVSVVICSAVLPFFEPFTFLRAAGMSLAMCAVAPIGDLSESLVKRDLGVKDMGSLVPGHGGLFDRIDAMLFCAPAAYVVYGVMGLVA